MKIDAVGLFVNDMERMVAFYRDVVGLKTNWNGDADAAFEAGGCRLIMYGRRDFENMTAQTYGYPKGRNGTMEIAFALPSYGAVDAEYERLVSLGAEAVFPPATMPWGQRTSYVADPEGNLLEIGSFGG